MPSLNAVCVLYTALDPQDYMRAEMPTCLYSLELNSVLCANHPLFSTLYKSEANIIEIAADYLLKSCVQLGARQQLLAGGNLRFTVQVLQAKGIASQGSQASPLVPEMHLGISTKFVRPELGCKVKLPQSFRIVLPQRLVLVVLAVQRHVLGHDGHDLRVHVRLQHDGKEFSVDRVAICTNFFCILRFSQLLRWTYPEPVLVENVAGDPNAYYARHGRDGDEPAELRHVVSCVTGPEKSWPSDLQMADA
jgi:hypothetical protein